MWSRQLRSTAFNRSILRTTGPARNFLASQTRLYANEPSRGATTGDSPNASNVRSSPSANPEASGVNSSRGTESLPSGPQDTQSLQTPVSNPDHGGMGVQEEPQPSQDNMRSDPAEPDHVKRERVEKEGQKPLDPADK